MENVINAQERFAKDRERRAASGPADSVRANLKKLVRVPLSDRAVFATRLGELAAKLAPHNPLDGAKRIFVHARREDKWAKRKRLIRLPGEQESVPEDYGTYEASGPMWAALASAAAELLNPQAEGRARDREEERVFRNIALGTSLLPREYVLPSEATHTSELVGDVAKAISRKIQSQARIQELWEILRAAPFALAPVYPETEVAPGEIQLASQVSALRRGDGLTGYFSTGDPDDWAYPIVRIGVLRKFMQGRIYIPPHHIRDALLNPFDWTRDGDGPNQIRVSDWLSDEGTVDEEFSPNLGFGWTTMPMETTRSVYLQACPQENGDVGLWLKINETFVDNFIPHVSGLDHVEASYRRRPPSSALPWSEPFELEDDDQLLTQLGILRWPSWCEGLISEPSLWRDGIIGIRDDMDTIFVKDFAGDPRRRREWMNPPELTPEKDSPQHQLPEGHWDYVPDGIGGWIDDPNNHELMAALFANPTGTTFLPLIAQDDQDDVPCRPGSIAESLLRNVGCHPDEQLAGMMINQANAFAEAGMQFHQARVERFRSKLAAHHD